MTFAITVGVVRVSVEGADDAEAARAAASISAAMQAAAAAEAARFLRLDIAVDGETLTREQVRDRVFSAPERARTYRAALAQVESGTSLSELEEDSLHLLDEGQIATLTAIYNQRAQERPAARL